MAYINGKWRQKLHLEPPQGWMNDPNGLCYFKGKYHFYFQYSPDSSVGAGQKCWGHYQSDNLVNWEFTGTVLYPDTVYDKDGVYSGCAVVNNNILHIFYTGNVKEKGDFDYILSGRGANVIHVTSKDGITMSEKKVVLKNSDYPSFCSCHVRDPKVWFEDEKWHMVLGARTRDDKGCVLFYTSDDLENWQFSHYDTTNNLGYMWECPDVFSVDDNKFLSISPQGLKHYETRFQNVYQSGYFKYDSNLDENNFYEWDYGFDFYAPQTFETPDKRRILVGWAGIGDIPYSNPTTELGYQHCLTIPREISLSNDGKLLQNPICEIENLRKDKLNLSENIEYKLNLPFEFIGKTETDFSIFINDSLVLSYSDNMFKMEFSEDNLGAGRTIRKAYLSYCKNIRIILDQSTVEVFLNDGEVVLTSRFYPADNFVKLRFLGLLAVAYTLNGMEVKYLGE